jgi:hypothetical protein
MVRWNHIRDTLIKDEGKRWIALQSIALVFLTISASAVLITKAPFHAFGIFYASLLIIFRLRGGKKSFLFPLFLMIPLLAYLANKQPQEDFLWNIAWISTLYLSVLIFHLVKQNTETIFSKIEEDEKVLKRDLDLWKSRFETLSEKKVSDKVAFEEELEKIKSVISEKEDDLNLLRKIIHLSHKETRKIEEKFVRFSEDPSLIFKKDETTLLEVKKLESEIEKINAAYKEIESKAETLREENEFFQDELSKKSEWRDKYEEIKVDFEKEIRKNEIFSSEIDSLKIQIEKLQESQKNLISKEIYDEEKTRLKAEMDINEERYKAELQEFQKSLEEANQFKEKELSESKEKKEALKENKKLQTRISELEANLEASKLSSMKEVEEIEALIQEVKDFKAVNHDLKAQLDQANEALVNEKRALVEKLELESENKALKDKVLELEFKSESSKNDSQKEVSEVATLLEELNRLKEGEQKTKALLEEANKALESQREALKHRQTINESLQGKKTSTSAISLKDLMKKS